MRTPLAEIEIDAGLVRSLLQSQHPDLAHLPIAPANSGWDNAMFRLGEQWAVRVPRRQLGAQLIQQEQTWLPLLAPQLPLPVPLPICLGTPDGDYPWCWSVVPWLAGETADRQELTQGEAERFVDFLRSLHSLHTPAPNNAPAHSYRGVPLVQRSEVVETGMKRLAQKTAEITPTIRHLWQQALAAPKATESRWLHGDLHPHNVIVKDGVIAGVIDWGDLTSGDVATDLAAIWMLFAQQGERVKAIRAYRMNEATGLDKATRLRAQGWAIFFATVLLETGLVDNPSHAAIGRNTLRRLDADYSLLGTTDVHSTSEP